MKKLIFVISALFLFILSMTAQVSKNKYDSDWKQVSKFEKDDLPQSAAKVVDDILKKAIADKDIQQVIKAYLHKDKYKIIIDRNDNLNIFSDLQELFSLSQNESEKALLHSILAELYINYYSLDRWKINNRTALSDVVPEDMQEWTTNIFINKTMENLNASIANKDALHKSSTKQYQDIILLGDDSQKYYPTLYDFLMTRAIHIARRIPADNGGSVNITDTDLTIAQLSVPADQYLRLTIPQKQSNLALNYYQQYFRDLLSRDMIPTVILTELDKVGYMGSLSYEFQSKKVEFLKVLQNKYKDNNAVIEVIIAIGDVLYGYGNNNTESNKQTELYQLYTDGLKRYADYERIDILKGRVNELEYPTLNIKAKQIYFSKDSVNIDISHKNLQALKEYPTLQLVKVEKGDSIVVRKIKIDFSTKESYIAETKTIDIGPLESGNYDIIYRSDSKEDMLHYELYNRYLSSFYGDSQGFVVSDLTAYSRNNAYQECEVYVVDRRSGKPIEGVTVNLYKSVQKNNENKDELLKTLTTDKIGRVNFKNISEINSNNYNRLYYTISYGKDTAFPKQYISNNNVARPADVITEAPGTSILYEEDEDDFYGEMSLFVDRNIYRPGQTVYFKAIAAGENRKVGANKNVEVSLYDANGDVVEEKELKTNEFGSVSGEFILPKSGLLGEYYIQVDCDSEDAEVYFRVEEYKRPTFDITFDKISKTYRFGEEVTIKGYARNFSGINLQDANVEYQINGYPLRLWNWGSSGNNTFEQGNVKTNMDGSFEIKFTPQPKDIAPGIIRKNVYNYTINASVTDLNGETQSSSFSMSVSDVSMVIGIEIPNQIEKSDTAQVIIQARNLNWQEIKTSGRYNIYALDDNDSIKTEVLNGTFSETGVQSGLRSSINKLPSGKYRIKVIALDDKGNEVDNQSDFVLFSYKDKRPPIKTNGWLVEKNKIFGSGKNAEVLFGVTDKDMYVLYQIYNNQEVFTRELIKISNANRLFTIPYKAEYGDKVYLTLTYVKDEKFYNNQVLLEKEVEKKDSKLVLKLESFRDKMRPGSEETWTLSVKDTKGNPLSAEILASMYDASLDKLYNNYYEGWKLNVPTEYYEYLSPAYYSYSWFTGAYFANYPLYRALSQLNMKEFSFDKINWYGFDFRNSIMEYKEDQDKTAYDGLYGYIQKDKMMIRGSNSVLAGRVPGIMMDSSAELSEVVTVGYGSQLKKSITGSMSSVVTQEVSGTELLQEAPQIRKNFNETAFFYPYLRTNEKGETLISFTTPESNTTWRFRAFAHDKDLKSGLLEQYVITRKELMVTPNMPRFLRQGDKTNISTKVSNLSETTISGKVYIEFFDPITDKVIDLNIADKEKSFSIEKGNSTSVGWTFDIPADIELMGVRIVAGNNAYSDGEQHVLAVLSNRMLVTESMPVDVNKAGASTFEFDKLVNNNSSTLSNYRLTFEFTSNPAWYAVMAMPTLSNPVSDNAFSWFASYYVNRLGQSIIQRYPRVQTIIETWKNQGGDKETLLSNLQKDEELKNVLLAETPWVMEAKSETEQMQRLSLLLDMNRSAQLVRAATDKLTELQDPLGGWCWYKGLYPNRSMTQYFLFAFADMQTYGQMEFPQEIKEMQIKALRFIDLELLADYTRLKKDNKNWQNIKSISVNQLEYLFVRSSYHDIPINQETREAERFYTSVVSKNWRNLNLYERSLLSIVLKRNGEKALATQITQSIRERAVVKDKQGMYWPNNKNRTFLTMSAVCNHVFLMKALLENGASEKEIDLMKQWLIKQKQTQVWESTNATIDAINILLGTGSDWFAEDDSVTTIKVGKESVSTKSKEVGTGYIKAAWDKSDIKKEMGKVTIDRPNNKPSYGALYWQYYEDLDKITSHKAEELNVNKELYKEVVTANGKDLVSITENSPLKVGDKVIVRLTVRVTNDMEFVQLKDMRAPCFEPVNTISGTSWSGEAVYYHETKDASTNFFFDQLQKGTYVFEYPVYVNRTGEYSNGVTTIQCLYAPEFVSHTQGIKVTVE
jgi:uncharacterized protein YfaS (alpha-2-macroglobulin family)